MTHKDIYTKFLIEYDKANVTSSYPSLTEYEIATVLDKAYNALIAQKVTGNNVRRVPFEADVKAISDITPLILKLDRIFVEETDIFATNVKKTELPSSFLYYVSANLIGHMGSYSAYDQLEERRMPVQLVDHQTASKFLSSTSNMPWIKIPVGYIEGNMFYVVYDPLSKYKFEEGEITYIRQPNKFVKDIEEGAQDISFFECPQDASDTLKRKYEFECNSTVAEELVSLAISFALENVESPRLNTKLNMRGLEA